MKRLLVVGLTSWLLLACSPSPPVKLGFIAGVSGRFADLGGTGRNGALLAVEMRNQSGGINGRRVEILVRDDEQDPAKAQAALRDLVREGASVVAGPMTSSMGVALSPVAEEQKIVVIGGTVTTTALTGRDDYFFRVIASTRTYARSSASAQRSHFGATRVCIVADEANRDYTESWSEEFASAFREQGGEILCTLRFDSRQPRVYGELAARALAFKPDLVAIAASATDAALLAQKLRQIAPDIRLAGGGWTASETLIQLGGKAVEGMVVEHYYNRYDSSAVYRNFVRAFKDRFGYDPGYAGIAGFDAASVAMDALAVNPTRETVKGTLLARRSFSGIQDKIHFDEFGDAQRTVYLSIIRNGQFAPALAP